MGLGLLSSKQEKSNVIYLIFKGEEPVYIGLSNNYERRVYENHFSLSYRKAYPTKTLYKAIDKYGEGAFEAFIYSQHNYRDEAAKHETDLIVQLKGMGLARYNQYNYAKYMYGAGIGGVSPYDTDIHAKEERKTAYEELDRMRNMVDANLRKGLVKSIINDEDSHLYKFLIVKVGYHNDKPVRKDSRKKVLAKIKKLEKAREENEEIVNEDVIAGYGFLSTGTKTFVPEEGSLLASMVAFHQNTSMAEYEYEMFIEGARFTLDYLYNEASPLEQYVFTLALTGYSDEDIAYELNLDEYELSECIRNLSDSIHGEAYLDLFERGEW